MKNRLLLWILLLCCWSPLVSSAQGRVGDSLPPQGDGSGSVYVEQYLVQDQWHGYCLPVKTSLTYPFISLNLDMRWYDEPLHQWVQVVDSTGDSLLSTPMKGYHLYSSSLLSGTNVSGVTGQLNTGPISYPVTCTGLPGGETGWNLVGNPYPSAINWNLVDLDQVDPTIYIYSSLWHNYIFWNRNNGIHTSICRNVVPAMQGFFVHCYASPPGTGLVTMTNLARLHDPGQLYLDNPDYDRLLILSAVSDNYKDESIIWFTDTSGVEFRSGEDALKLDGEPSAPQLFSMIPGGIRLALNTRPFEEPGTRVNLGFSGGVAGIDTLTASNLQSFPDTLGIWLEDKKENQFQKLNDNPQYIFSSTPEDDTARFVILFSNAYMGLAGTIRSEIRIWVSGDHLFVDLTRTTDGTQAQVPLELFDVTGKLIYTSSLPEKKLSILSPGLAKGYYIVRVTTGRETVVRKVFL
jgi:trimeric autotransporter adhesin